MTTPAGTIRAIDLSHWQGGSFDLGAMHSRGVRAAIIQATHGAGGVDPLAAAYAERARGLGWRIGFYHFAEHGDVTAEALHHLAVVHRLGLRPGRDFVSFLDYETGPYSRAWVLAFLDRVAGVQGGAGLYAPIAAVAAMRLPLRARRFAYWQPDWAQAPHRSPAPWTAWTVWQSSDNGYGRHVDLDTLRDLPAVEYRGRQRPPRRRHAPDHARARVTYLDGHGKPSETRTGFPGVWVSTHPSARRRGVVTIHPPGR